MTRGPNGHLFAGGANLSAGLGVLRSTDDGLTWQLVNNGLSNKLVNSVAVGSDGLVFAGTSGQLFRSRDDGESWGEVGGGFLGTTTIDAVAADTLHNVFAGTRAGFFRSTDNGITWQVRNTGLPGSPINSIARSSEGTLIVGLDGEIYRSTDGGGLWLPTSGASVPSGYTRGLLALPGNTLLAGDRANSYRSTNDGANWEISNNGLPLSGVLEIIRTEEGSLFAAGETGVSYSTDQGATWWAGAGLPSVSFQSVMKSPVYGLFAGSVDGYVYRSTDSGRTWVQSNSGWIAAGVFSLATNDAGEIFAGNVVLFRSSNGGASWAGTDIPGGGVVSDILVAANHKIFLGTSSGVYWSSDDGGTLTQGQGISGTIYDIALDSAGVLFAVSGSTVYNSLDQGITWNPTGAIASAGPIRSIAVNRLGHLFAATADSTLFRSVDAGRHWRACGSGTGQRAGYSVISDENNSLWVGTSHGVFTTPLPTTMLDLSPDSLDLGIVKVGASASDSILLRNASDLSTVLFSVHADNPVFNVAVTPLTLLPGGKAWLRCTFTPPLFGRFQANVTVVSNASTSPDSIRLTGTGKAAGLRSSPKVVQFGEVQLHDSSKRAFQLENVGNDTLYLADVLSSNIHFAPQRTTAAIVPGEMGADTLTFAPVRLGVDSALIVIQSNSVWGPDTIRATATGIGTPKLALASQEIGFGTVTVGSFVDSLLGRSNTGNDTLVIRAITSNHAALSVRPGALTLPPGMSAIDTVRFAPATVGFVSGQLSYSSNAQAAPMVVQLQGVGASGSGVIPVDNTTPSAYALEQNYPNPFNGSTNIRFSLPAPGNVILEVFDITGSHVATLINEMLPAGHYEFEWRAGNLATGVYLVRFRSGSFTATVKVMLVR